MADPTAERMRVMWRNLGPGMNCRHVTQNDVVCEKKQNRQLKNWAYVERECTNNMLGCTQIIEENESSSEDR